MRTQYDKKNTRNIEYPFTRKRPLKPLYSHVTTYSTQLKLTFYLMCLTREVIYCFVNAIYLNMNLMDDDASTLATVDLLSLATPINGAGKTLLAAKNAIES